MTELLDRAVRAARALSPAEQDDIARIVLTLTAGNQSVVELTPEEVASFAESLEQSARREFASEDQVRAVWAKHGL